MRQMTQKPKRRADFPRLRYGGLRDILPVLDDPAVRERFETKIDRSGECHLWQAGGTNAGYGLFQGSIGYRGFSFLAHRIAWALDREREPGNAVIRHRCDTPRCCNPAHLDAGTALDNVQDAIERGRMRYQRGSRGPQQRNHGKPAEARRMRYEERMTAQQIAERLGVHRATVARWLGPV